MKDTTRNKVIRFIKKYLLFRKERKYNLGWVPDKKDDRDITYKVRMPGQAPSSTYRKNISEFRYRYDQGNLGACVGHGVCEAFRRVIQVNYMPDFEPSRLFAYYIAREDKNNDTGATIRDAFKAINKTGLCSEQSWRYVPVRFAEKPPQEAFIEAEKHQSIKYERVPQTKEAIMEVISQGYPIVFGALLYDSFMSKDVAKTGIVPKPSRCFEECHGGHCMAIFDYDEKGCIILNSWSDQWGQAGVCHIPWDYILDKRLCSDMWVLYTVEV